MLTNVLLHLLFLVLINRTNSSASTSDFLIVGAGTAGCVVAANLCTRLSTARITLLERAIPRDADAEFLDRAPLNALRATQSSSVSEVLSSLPNPGLNSRTVSLTTGNTYGGTSATNALNFGVPVAESVNRCGIRGLNYTSARPLYDFVRKKVHFHPQQPPFRQIYASDYIAAAEAAGFSKVPGPFQNCLCKAIWKTYVATNAKERRTDSCTAYVKPVLSGACASNLRVRLGATATKVIIDKDTSRTIGVEHVHTSDKNKTNRLRLSPSGEIILTAGGYGSPKLLQLSVVGPAEVLRAAGIVTVVDLAVGERTQSQAFNFISSQYVGIPPEPAAVSSNLNETARRQFEKGEGGVYGKANAALSLVVGLAGYGLVGTTVGFGTGQGDVEFASFCLGNPRSFGYLRVRDVNPFSSPVVQTNLYAERVDVERMLRCMKSLAQVHKELNKRFKVVVTTPTDAQRDESYLRSTAGSSVEFVGGCRVGAVVSGSLRVHGVSRLRVLDSSVIRRVPSRAAKMASVYMIVEYVSRRIADGYKCAQAGRRSCGAW